MKNWIFILSLSISISFGALQFLYIKNNAEGSLAPSSAVSDVKVCIGHKGVNCSIINTDASVVCNDGSVDDSVPFIYAVPQCRKEIEKQTQEQSEFMTKSGCFPPSEMGCINDESYNSLVNKLRLEGLENSELGKNELNQCKSQIDEYRGWDEDFRACLEKNNNPDFNLPGNRLVQPILKTVFCPVFYGNSTYDYDTDMCFCDKGYFLSGEKCVEASQICRSKYGAGSKAQNGNCITNGASAVPSSVIKKYDPKTYSLEPTIQSLKNLLKLR